MNWTIFANLKQAEEAEEYCDLAASRVTLQFKIMELKKEWKTKITAINSRYLQLCVKL